MQQEREREGRRVRKRAHVVQQDIDADVEESDIYSTAGGTAGQPATGERTRRRQRSQKVTESKSVMDRAQRKGSSVFFTAE